MTMATRDRNTSIAHFRCKVMYGDVFIFDWNLHTPTLHANFYSSSRSSSANFRETFLYTYVFLQLLLQIVSETLVAPDFPSMSLATRLSMIKGINAVLCIIVTKSRVHQKLAKIVSFIPAFSQKRGTESRVRYS